MSQTWNKPPIIPYVTTAKHFESDLVGYPMNPAHTSVHDQYLDATLSVESKHQNIESKS